ncbi:hypothetical protein K438DRAFT_1969530 [Mycena galopus ATCC 62051]|nr:hypothetical protein K438DRAFT_1969530 [Mycena galopus ATCC 62051]
MSSISRKCLTTEHSKDNDTSSSSESSDEEIAPTVQQVSHYDLSYPRLSTVSLPKFQEHKFWHSFGNEGPGCDLITFALRLPFFCLAVFTLNPSADVPQDITLCLTGVGRLIENLRDPIPIDWKEFLFPVVDEDKTPRYPANIEPSASTNAPSLVDLENAPHLTMTKAVPPPRPVKEDASSSKIVMKTKGANANTRLRSKPTLSSPRTPLLASPRCVPATSLPPRRVPLPGSSLLNRQKQAAKLLSTLPQIETKLRQFADSKREIGWATFSADEFIVFISVSKKQGSALPHPRSHLGTKDFHRNTTDYDVEPLAKLPLIELKPVRVLKVDTAVRPLIGCTPCNLLRLTCQPNGLSISCQSCNLKKLGALCDHNMDSVRFAGLMHDLVDKAVVFLPSIPISIERLKCVAEMVATARQNFLLVHGEFCLRLHTFLCAICHQADVLGSEGFRALFFGIKEGEDAATAFNTLIGLYNTQYPKDAPVTELKVDNNQNAIGDLDLSPPMASDDEVLLALAAKPASRSATKSPKKQAPLGSG